jgi:hypothetical protein
MTEMTERVKAFVRKNQDRIFGVLDVESDANERIIYIGIEPDSKFVYEVFVTGEDDIMDANLNFYNYDENESMVRKSIEIAW